MNRFRWTFVLVGFIIPSSVFLGYSVANQKIEPGDAGRAQAKAEPDKVKAPQMIGRFQLCTGTYLSGKEVQTATFILDTKTGRVVRRDLNVNQLSWDEEKVPIADKASQETGRYQFGKGNRAEKQREFGQIFILDTKTGRVARRDPDVNSLRWDEEKVPIAEEQK